MGSGNLEVEVIEAKYIKDRDLFGRLLSCSLCCGFGKGLKSGKMDPYVLVRFGNEERKSSIALGQGRNPIWNEKFNFRAEYPGGEDPKYKLVLRIMDKDKFSDDDFIGETTIYLKDVLSLGVETGKAELQRRKYRVVLGNKSYAGEICVAVNFTRQVDEERKEDL